MYAISFLYKTGAITLTSLQLGEAIEPGNSSKYPTHFLHTELSNIHHVHV